MKPFWRSYFADGLKPPTSKDRDKGEMNIHDAKWRPLIEWVSDSPLMLLSSRVDLCSTIAQLQATEIQSGNVGILAFLAAKGRTQPENCAKMTSPFQRPFYIGWGTAKISVLSWIVCNRLPYVLTQVCAISARKIRRTREGILDVTSLIGLFACMQ